VSQNNGFADYFLGQHVTNQNIKGMLLTGGKTCLSYLEEGFVNELIQI
jgi:hypothetical protein